MKFPSPLLTSVFFMAFSISSCSGDKVKHTLKSLMADEQSDTTSEITDTLVAEVEDWERLVMKDVSEGNSGEVTYSMPLPESWSIHTEPGAPYFITGPGNLQVKGVSSKAYEYSKDPYFRDMFIQQGIEMHPIPTVEQLFQNYLIPQLKEAGYTFVDYEELPDVAVPMQWYSDQLYNPYGFVKSVKSFGINVKDDEGNDVYMISSLNSSDGSPLTNWYVGTYFLVAEPNTFERAKKTFVFGLGNIRFNLEPIMRYNVEEAQRNNQSWASFNSRMKANQIAFEQRQRNHINMVNGVNDAIMSGYNSSNAASDRIHERTIDAIREEDKVYNPSSGEVHKVEQGYNQYWMNSDGVYIATESPNYDPNRDENLNHKNWDGLQKVGN